RQLLGERRRKGVVTAVSIFMQRAGPPGGGILLPVNIAFGLGEPLAVRDVLPRRHVRSHGSWHTPVSSHHVILRHPRVLFGRRFGGRHGLQRRQVLVPWKFAALHVIEGAKKIAHALRHMFHVLICLFARPVIL